MQLTEQQLADFRSIYKERFGIDLTDTEALDKSACVLTLLEVVLREKLKKLSTTGRH